MLEENEQLEQPLNERRPERTLLALLTPELFRKHAHSRLYGWLLHDYRSNPGSLARDMSHRQDDDWQEVSRRLGWPTWKDCGAVLPGSCPWMSRET